ncbi:MAG TPA: hypothetical protein VFL04_03735, partial [Rectinemataceae bacterium]|nr:hypothetical protein [Rectinemataceae bacterium]
MRAHRPRPPMGAGGLAAFAAAVCSLALLSCSRPAPSPGFVFKVDSPVLLVATGSGLRAPNSGESPFELSAPAAMASLAPNADVLTANGRLAMVAVNRVGISLIEPTADGSSFTLANRPAPEHFAQRTAAGAWPRGEGFLVHLYHDPFAPAGEGASASSALLALDRNGTARLLTEPGSEGEGGRAQASQLFAIYPGRDGDWFAQLRTEDSDRVEGRYLRISAPDAPERRETEISRSQFERSLQPQLLSQAGPLAPAIERTVLLAAGGSALA